MKSEISSTQDLQPHLRLWTCAVSALLPDRCWWLLRHLPKAFLQADHLFGLVQSLSAVLLLSKDSTVFFLFFHILKCYLFNIIHVIWRMLNIAVYQLFTK